MDKILRLLGFRYATAGLVLVALLALYGAATLSRPEDRTRAAAKHVEAPVTWASLVCPWGGEDGRLSLLTPPQGASGMSASGKGRVDVVQTTNGKPLASVPNAGTSWAKDLRRDENDSYTVRGSGPLAAGLEAERTIHWPGGPDRGLAGTRCARPGTDLWFLGPGPVAAERIDLYLTNVDAQPASVDVTAMSGEGPLDTVDGLGIPVKPYSTKIVRIGKSAEGLGDIVTTARDLALHVRASTGRVAASVRVRIDDKKGIEWVPLSPAPATSLVVPGVPGGSGRRQLLVGVPGEQDARIRIQVITASGAFAPQGQDVLDAPAETVTPFDLDRALSGKPAAVRLVSDRPIVTGLSAQRGADVAFGTATPQLGPHGGLITDNRFSAYLQLTAPAGAATVRVTSVDPQGQGPPQDIKVGAGRTVEIKLAGPGEGGYGTLIVPRPGSGPVHAARTLATGKGDKGLFTILPIGPALSTVILPTVGDSQTALIP
ncbi:DUF5719 family protein [Actinomadura rudentiformis]|uniref:Uncharacterized protein n=1 Tax=Actinomadura rudentiformis TaxID=359158 RepID=A0A6H9Z168_9ACTN|nr:DUF5719 family protein [Actinomadura rudentiformis]KAB2351525.1 hypothetical protein F8566_04655 [Actinomadura rudentiformis]